MRLDCGERRLDLSQPCVMGVLNVTPDSFSDGGRHLDPQAALEWGLQMAAEGARFIDVGGESTRPGAATVPVEEELRRVLPVIAALRRHLPDAIVSIDTRKPAVMRAALAAGAEFVNDVSALTEPGALEVLAASGAGVCLMHMQGEPATMQAAPRYDDVVAEVRAFLERRLAACVQAGIAASRLVIDPGFGFGKTASDNLALLDALPGFARLGRPVLVGLSRKSLLGRFTGRPPGERLAAGVATATIAVLHGASIVRAHDVAATVDALRIVAALRTAGRVVPPGEDAA